MVARQIDAERLVVVRGLYAWAPKAKDREPAAQVPTTGKEHDATLVYERRGDGFFPVPREGATNREVFEAYVERMLAPELCPCQVVVIGNLSDHKGERFKEQIEGSGSNKPLSTEQSTPPGARLCGLLRFRRGCGIAGGVGERLGRFSRLWWGYGFHRLCQQFGWVNL